MADKVLLGSQSCSGELHVYDKDFIMVFKSEFGA
jgi:hypothetical protein